MKGGQLSGIVVIDKPGNISSAGVVRFIKKTLKAGKVGHAGTLDPFAEGVLICCLKYFWHPKVANFKNNMSFKGSGFRDILSSF